MYRSGAYAALVVNLSLGLSLFACSGDGGSGPGSALVDKFGRSLSGDGARRMLEPPGGQRLLALGGDTDQLFASTAPIDTGGWADAVAIGDVTGDSREDVVITTTRYYGNPSQNQVLVYAQSDKGSLDPPQAYDYLEQGYASGLVLADLDGDAILDIVVGHGEGVTVVIPDRGSGSTTTLVPSAQAAYPLSATDVNRDGHLDIVGLGSGKVTVFLGDGAGGFASQYELGTNAAGYNDQEVGDLNGDGIDDLAVMSGQLYALPNLSVHLHDGVDTLLAPATYRAAENENTNGIGLGDINGDGLTDVVLSRGGNSPTHLWLYMQSEGTLQGPTTIESYDLPETVTVADIDLDGRDDVLVLHAGWQSLGVYLQNDQGLQAEQLVEVPYVSHYNPQGLAVGDIDGDGCPDVAIADYNNGLVTLRGRSCQSDPEPVLPQRPWSENAQGTLRTGYAWHYTLGYHFTPTVDGTISQLGGLFSGTKKVSLWHKQSGALLAQAYVSSTDSWSFVDIDPATVAAGETYTVAAAIAGSGGSYSSPVQFPAMHGDVTIEGSTYVYGDGRPTNLITSTMYGQVDVTYNRDPSTPPPPPPDQTVHSWQDNQNGTLATGVPWNFTMGYNFETARAGEVVALGGLFSGTKTCSLWRQDTGELLAQASVTGDNTWRYAAITPVAIEPGVAYTVAVYLGGQGASYSSGIQRLPQTYGDITITASTYVYGDGRPVYASTSTMYGQADVAFLAY